MYLVCLSGFIIWIGLIISYIFFHGVKPSVVVGEKHKREVSIMAVEREIKPLEELREELKEMKYDPWLPIESKLVNLSLLLGIILLVILVWISYAFFPASQK